MSPLNSTGHRTESSSKNQVKSLELPWLQPLLRTDPTFRDYLVAEAFKQVPRPSAPCQPLHPRRSDISPTGKKEHLSWHLAAVRRGAETSPLMLLLDPRRLCGKVTKQSKLAARAVDVGKPLYYGNQNMSCIGIPTVGAIASLYKAPPSERGKQTHPDQMR